VRDISSISLQLIITSFRQESQLPTACLGLQAGGYEDGCYSPYVSKTPQAVRLSLRPCTSFIGLRAQKVRFVIRMEEFGETWDDAPVRRPIFFCGLTLIYRLGAQNDMLMWLIYEAKGVEKSLEGLARRLLMVNISAIHSTSLVRTINPSLAVIGPSSHGVDGYPSVVPPPLPP
jgi:hypothetical protein